MVLMLHVPATAKEWYEGGTLHDATIAQWKRAKRQDKIATCADWVSALLMKSKLNLAIASPDDLKNCVTALVDYIDKSSKNTKSLDKENANSVALLGMMVAGWFRQGDNSDLLSIITASKPQSPLRLADNAEQKLKATRAIAKKYGIKAGDVFTVQSSLLPPVPLADDSEGYEGSSETKLIDYPPAVNNKRLWVMENIHVDTKWEPDAMTKRFGKYERYDPSTGNPRILQMFYFKDIDMTFLVNMLSFKVVTWRSGRADS